MLLLVRRDKLPIGNICEELEVSRQVVNLVIRKEKEYSVESRKFWRIMGRRLSQDRVQQMVFDILLKEPGISSVKDLQTRVLS